MAENYDDPYSDKPSNAERAAELRLVKDPSMYKKTTDSKKKKLANFGDYMAKNESRAHKILATKLGNMERMNSVRIPSPAERRAQMEPTPTPPPPFVPELPNQNPSARRLARQGMNSVKEAEDLTAVVKPSQDQTKYPKGDAKTDKTEYCDSCDKPKRACECDDVNEAMLDEASRAETGELFKSLLDRASDAAGRGDHTQAKRHLANAQTARYGILAKHIPKHAANFAKYKELKNSYTNSDEHVREETLDELSKGTLGSYASKANQDALDKRQEAGHTAGAERAELKLKAQRREAGVKMADRKITKEDFDIWDAELAEIDEAIKTVKTDEKGNVVSWSQEGDWVKSAGKKQGTGKAANLAGKALQATRKLSKEEVELDEVTSPMQKLRDAHDRHMNKALAANRAGDDTAVKVHQQYMQKLTAKMSKLKQNEAWNVSNRNNQRSIQVGHKVRSYDFPGMHDSHYIEGHVVGQTPSSFHIKVNKVVRDNKEIPIPSHMHHVEAPKGKSLWTDAVAVHKIHEATDTVVDEKGMKVANPELPATGAAKTFSGLKARLKK